MRSGCAGNCATRKGLQMSNDQVAAAILFAGLLWLLLWLLHWLDQQDDDQWPLG